MLRTIMKGIETKTEAIFMMCLCIEYSMLFPHNNRTGKQNWMTDMGQFSLIKQVNSLGDFSLKTYKVMSDM